MQAVALVTFVRHSAFPSSHLLASPELRSYSLTTYANGLRRLEVTDDQCIVISTMPIDLAVGSSPVDDARHPDDEEIDNYYGYDTEDDEEALAETLEAMEEAVAIGERAETSSEAGGEDEERKHTWTKEDEERMAEREAIRREKKEVERLLSGLNLPPRATYDQDAWLPFSEGPHGLPRDVEQNRAAWAAALPSKRAWDEVSTDKVSDKVRKKLLAKLNRLGKMDVTSSQVLDALKSAMGELDAFDSRRDRVVKLLLSLSPFLLVIKGPGRHTITSPGAVTFNLNLLDDLFAQGGKKNFMRAGLEQIMDQAYIPSVDTWWYVEPLLCWSTADGQEGECHPPSVGQEARGCRHGRVRFPSHSRSGAELSSCQDHARSNHQVAAGPNSRRRCLCLPAPRRPRAPSAPKREDLRLHQGCDGRAWILGKHRTLRADDSLTIEPGGRQDDRNGR